jgi:hypothetical protein
VATTDTLLVSREYTSPSPRAIPSAASDVTFPTAAEDSILPSQPDTLTRVTPAQTSPTPSPAHTEASPSPSGVDISLHYSSPPTFGPPQPAQVMPEVPPIPAYIPLQQEVDSEVAAAAVIPVKEVVAPSSRITVQSPPMREAISSSIDDANLESPNRLRDALARVQARGLLSQGVGSVASSDDTAAGAQSVTGPIGSTQGRAGGEQRWRRSFHLDPDDANALDRIARIMGGGGLRSSASSQ